MLLLWQLGWAAGPTKLSVCAEDLWPPFSFVRNGIPVGASVDLVTAALKIAGVQTSFQSGSYARCLQLVRDGRIDALLDVAQNDERKPQLIWPQQPLLRLELHLVGNTSQHDIQLDFEAMQHKRVGITRGYEYPNRMMIQPDIQLIESPSELSNFRHLARGDLDFMLLSRGTLATLLIQLGNAERQKIRDWGKIDQISLYLAFNPAHPQARAWATAFDLGMEALRKSGEDQRILDRWHAAP